MEKNYSFLEFLIDSPVYIISDNVVHAEQKIQATENTEAKTDIKKSTDVILKRVIAYTNSSNNKDLEFLNKILQAVKVSSDEACISENTATAPDNISSNIILYFGDHKDANSIPLYSPSQINGKTILHTDGLSVIQQDVNKKKQLWTNLQSIFKL